MAKLSIVIWQLQMCCMYAHLDFALLVISAHQLCVKLKLHDLHAHAFQPGTRYPLEESLSDAVDSA